MTTITLKTIPPKKTFDNVIAYGCCGYHNQKPGTNCKGCKQPLK